MAAEPPSRAQIFAVTISQVGRVKSVNADTGPLDGNNIFRRFWDVYGYFADWDQSLWVQLGQYMEGFEPEYSIDGVHMYAAAYEVVFRNLMQYI